MVGGVQFGTFFKIHLMMTFTDIQQQFALCKSWEERYRLLIQLSRTLPKLSEAELASLPEIHGCESRLWFQFQASPRKVQAYSDARLMQGLLAVIIAYIHEKSDEELRQLDLQALFSELKIASHLTATRLNGIQQIGEIITSTA